ncbi:MAG: endolytic transglycosylase MltG [Oscillospiraceae bacterium]|nr:endolytic transglycosylase MltG [Oscillospiraceae bacterium]
MSEHESENRPRRSSSQRGAREEARRPAPSRARQPQSRGQARKKPMSGFEAAIYLVLIIGFSAILAGIIWLCAGDMLALNKAPYTAVFTVEEGATVSEVADILKDNGLIEYKSVFKLFCAFTHVERDEKLTAGTYELNTDMDYRALISSMGKSSANRTTTDVVITEGMTEAQIFEKLEESGVSTVAKLEDTAANYAFKYSFLQDIALGDPTRLEGYLFPDTYTFYCGEDPVNILNKMLLRFDAVVTDELRAQAEEKGYSLREILTIASLIEKETDGTDQKRIASVIYNRLDNPSAATNGYLQIDASIYYVTGRIVTVADYTDVDSLYNTYLHQGLPPGPIANPGMVAINAALNPAQESYYYYALGDDGTHHYFKTLAEQQSFLKQ